MIPVGLWGTEKVWARNRRLPRFEMLDRPEVSVRVGPPVELKRRKATTDTKRIMSAISALLPDEANKPYVPTPEELARTFPPGYRPGANGSSPDGDVVEADSRTTEKVRGRSKGNDE